MKLRTYVLFCFQIFNQYLIESINRREFYNSENSNGKPGYLSDILDNIIKIKRDCENFADKLQFFYYFLSFISTCPREWSLNYLYFYHARIEIIQ